MAQFRVEFVLDQASGKYLAELYNPDNQEELMARTEAIYPRRPQRCWAWCSSSRTRS